MLEEAIYVLIGDIQCKLLLNLELKDGCLKTYMVFLHLNKALISPPPKKKSVTITLKQFVSIYFELHFRECWIYIWFRDQNQIKTWSWCSKDQQLRYWNVQDAIFWCCLDHFQKYFHSQKYWNIGKIYREICGEILKEGEFSVSSDLFQASL